MISKNKFANNFKVKDMGPLEWFLGIQFNISDSVISLNQHLYVNNILTRFNMQNCTPRKLPCPSDLHKQLRVQSKPVKDQTLYREVVGSLIYLMHCTRPDISFVVNILSQQMSAPLEIHMKIAINVLKYLKYTIHYELKFFKSNENLNIQGFTDSDFAASPDRKSISGYCFSLIRNSALISWKSKKQTSTADSTCECEYIALSEAVKEALFLSSLFAELTLSPRQKVTIFADNQSAIALAHHPTFHTNSKHIDTKYHFVRDYTNKEYIEIIYIPSAQNIADIFTKPPTGTQLSTFSWIRGKILKEEGGGIRVQVNSVSVCSEQCLCNITRVPDI